MTHDESRSDRLASFLLKKVNKAIYEFDMIQDGDRIAVALSGGKDSFSLLEILRYRQRFTPEKYAVAAVHVIGDARGPDIPPYPQLERWLRERGIEYLIRPTYLPEGEKLPMSCERCAWNRRRTLFEMAKDLRCNKVAFGHHLDDLAETALLNIIYHGRAETMFLAQEFFGGALAIIRPLAYAPESEIKRFASAHEFPEPPPPCPLGEHTQRQRIKDLIGEIKKDCPDVKWNLARTALRAMQSYPARSGGMRPNHARFTE